MPNQAHTIVFQDPKLGTVKWEVPDRLGKYIFPSTEFLAAFPEKDWPNVIAGAERLRQDIQNILMSRLMLIQVVTIHLLETAANPDVVKTTLDAIEAGDLDFIERIMKKE